MKALPLVLCLCFYSAIARAQTPPGPRGGVDTRNEAAKLRLTTTIVEQYYDPAAPGFSLLRLVLRLTYTNTGERPVLLDKNSSLIYRSLVSKSLKAAASNKYESETVSSFFDLRAAGIRTAETPEENAFITLRPGESYAVEKVYGVNVDDCTEAGEGNLRPGRYFLQLRVATWYYLSRPEDYREQWRDKGYLWSESITSQPMPFSVEKKCAVSRP